MHRERRVGLILLLSFLLLAGTGTKAEAQLTWETEVHPSVGFFGAYVGWSNVVLWDPGLARLGLGVDFYAGTTQFDFHLVPLLRAELGWFYASGGWNIELRDAKVGTQPLKDGVLIAAGIAPDLVQAGYGRLGFDLGAELILRPFEDPSERPPAADVVAPWYVSTWFGGAAGEVLGFLVGSMQLRAGVLYTFPLD